MAKKSSAIKTYEVQELRNFKVLIIPGVLAESFISSSKNQIKLSILFEDAFKEQIKVLSSLGVDHQFLNLETENTPAENAQNIVKAVLSSSKPVLIYSHSKGGLDTLEAIRQNPSIIKKIHGWASIQSPFWGSTVASGFSENTILNETGNNLFEWMGGSGAGMNSLTLSERVNYMDSTEVRNLILEIKKNIKFINYGSYKTDTWGWDTPLEFFRNYTEIKDGINDGVVPLTSALMKEHNLAVDFIIETEVDHLMTMTRFRLENTIYDQKAHTLAVLRLLL